MQRLPELGFGMLSGALGMYLTAQRFGLQPTEGAGVAFLVTAGVAYIVYILGSLFGGK
jgi:hypothetical protein